MAYSDVRRDRIIPAAAVAAIHVLIGYALLVGLGVSALPVAVDQGLTLIDLRPDPPPPPEHPRPTPAHRPRKQGAASPPNLRAQPTEIVAPPPEIPLDIPPPVVTAPIAGPGAAPSAGAAAVKGPGTGSGGEGHGTGSGAGGNGDGGGDGDGGIPLRWLSGRIKDSDYPRDVLKAGIGGTVHLRFTVGVKGRVTDCTVTRSSGSSELDDTTCRLIQQRFRYKPSRDASGRPVPDVVTGEHEWSVYRDGRDSDPDR